MIRTLEELLALAERDRESDHEFLAQTTAFQDSYIELGVAKERAGEIAELTGRAADSFHALSAELVLWLLRKGVHSIRATTFDGSEIAFNLRTALGAPPFPPGREPADG